MVGMIVSKARIAYVGAWRDLEKIFVDDSNKGVTVTLPATNFIRAEDIESLKEILSKQEVINDSRNLIG